MANKSVSPKNSKAKNSPKAKPKAASKIASKATKVLKKVPKTKAPPASTAIAKASAEAIKLAAKLNASSPSNDGINEGVNKQRRVLGRGLSALLSDNETPKAPISSNALDMIPLSAITPNPKQPRTYFDKTALQELTQSIQTHGVIQPLTVRQVSPNNYELIAGQRRYEAAKRLNIPLLPAFIKQANDHQVLEMALIENIQRENLNDIEIACTYQRLIRECGLKQEEMARRVGKDRSTVTNYLRLLRLPDSIQASVRDKAISMGHARALLALEHPDSQLAIWQEILSKNLSVRETEQRVSSLLDRPIKKKEGHTGTKQQNALEKSLSAQYETRVTIASNRQGKGEVKLAFYSSEDLERLLEKMQETL